MVVGESVARRVTSRHVYVARLREYPRKVLARRARIGVGRECDAVVTGLVMRQGRLESEVERHCTVQRAPLRSHVGNRNENEW